jgi:N-acetylglutamate synthase
MTASFSYPEVLAMERAAARAWPALRIEHVGGWQVRLSGGGSRRANSVLPLAEPLTSFDESMAAVEQHYRAQNTRSYVQVSSISLPADLDARLAARGYTYEEPCLLMAKRLEPRAMPDGVEVTAEPTADWLSVYAEPLDAARRAAAPAVLAQVPATRAFLLVRQNGAPLSVALAVVAPDGVALVECVATQSAARRSGGAQRIMDALEAWSAANGATVAALQVVAGNKPAVTLYQRRGYVEAGRYHYRWRDVV